MKFLKFELIKLKVFNMSLTNHFSEKDVNDFISFFKKAFTVVYNYHINRKKILIVGISQKHQIEVNHLLKRTKHIFLSEKSLVTNNLNNKRVLFKKSYDLIIILNPEKHERLIKETLKFQIPTISFKKHSKHLNNSYNIPSEFLRIDFIKVKIFLLFLKAIIKKF